MATFFVATSRGLGAVRRLGGRAALSSLAAAPADAAEGREARAASAVLIEGASGFLQHSRNGALADLRTRVPLRCGSDDWALRLEVVPRAEQGWLEFSALHTLRAQGEQGERDDAGAAPPLGGGAGEEEAEERGEDEEEDGEEAAAAGAPALEGLRPADVLWSEARFGRFEWGWPSHRRSAAVEVRPDDGAAAVRRALADGLARLSASAAAARAEPDGGGGAAGGGDDDDDEEDDAIALAAQVEEDCALLEELARAHGSLGAAALPDALAPIVECAWYAADHAGCEAVFATARYNYAIEFSTS